MPTQSNKQTQNVKVIVNNKACCETKKRRPRRRPRPEASAEQPQEEIAVPASPMKDFARGLSAYPIRPTLYAPLSTTIQVEGGLRQVPSYFDKQLTNQQLTLEQLQRTVQEQYDDLVEQIDRLQPLPSIPSTPTNPHTPFASVSSQASNPPFRPATIQSLLSPQPSVQGGFPEIPEPEEVPDIVRGIINPNRLQPLTQEQRRALEGSGADVPEYLQMWRVEELFGDNHPYTRAFRLYQKKEGASKNQEREINKQIRRIAAEHNITDRTIEGVMAKLVSLPSER